MKASAKMNEFLKGFEEYCKTPGVESGKARSYAKAIEYLCDYLKITKIDAQAVLLIKELENDIYDKNSVLYKDLLLFLLGRGQKSYLENGYIKAGEDGRTSVDGIFAAGDARTKRLRQIITAVSDGANAVTSVQDYLISR